MAEYDAGEIFAQIVPSFQGVRQRIEAEAKTWARSIQDIVEGALPAALREGARTAGAQGAKAGSDFGGSFARTVRDRVDAALKALPKAKPGVDSTELDAELDAIRARLAALRDVRVGVDLGAAEALAEIDRLQERLATLGARSPDVQVRVDAAAALAELEAVQAAVDHLDHDTAHVDVDTSSAESGLSALTLAVLGLGPALIPIGAAATAGLAGIATVALSGAAGIGVLALAFNGVLGALQAVHQEHQKSATTARTSASAQVSAANQVKSAEAALANARASADSAAVRSAEQVANARRNVADVERQAADAIAAAAQKLTAAERTAADADRNAADAQERLNRAREQAARDLEDVANRAADAALSLRQANLDLTDEQAVYAKVMASSTATDEARARAQLSLDEATQRVTEAQQEATRSAADNAAAQAAGVNGADAVVTASQNVTDAARQQQQAHLDVTAARRDETVQAQQSAEQIARAQQQLTDAIRAQQDQARQSAYSVASAQRAVAAALDAQAQAAAPASAATDKAATALADLSPAGREFVGFVESTLLPAFHQIRNVAQENLFPGLERGIKAASPLMVPFTSFVAGLARTMGGLFAEAGKALTSPFWQQFFGYVAVTAGPTLVVFAHVLGNLAHGFAGLLMAFSPVVIEVGRGLLNLTGRFSDFGEHAGANGSFGRFIGYVQQNGPLVVSTIGELIRAIAHIVEAVAPIGTFVLGVIRDLAIVINAIPTPVLGALAAGILAVIGVVKVWTVAQAILDAVLEANPISLVITAIIGLAVALIYAYKHSETFRAIVTAIFNWVKANWPLLLGMLGGPIGLAAVEIIRHWGDIESGVKSAFHAISGAASGLWSDIKGFFIDGVNAVIGILDGFIDKINAVLGFFHLPKIPRIQKWSTAPPATKDGQHAPGGPTNARFADGGILPGYAPGVDSIVAMVSPGEAILRPEVTRWLGADTIHGWNAAARAGGLPHFDAGGIVGNVLGGVKRVGSDIAGGLRDVGGWIASKGLGGVLAAIEAPVHAAIRLLPHGMFREIANGLVDRIDHAVRGLVGAGGDQGTHGTSAAAAQATARGLLSRFGWDGAQMPSLLSLWNQESGWNYLATNPTSGAYGIPQSLPAGKMASAGADWRTNPLTQMMWGLNYIKGRYGSPAGAWAHEVAFNWYDQGGYLPPGPSLVMNGTGRPEPVLTHDQLASLANGRGGGVAAFEGDLYLDSGEFLGVVRGEAQHVVDGHDRRGLVLARKGAP